MDFWLANESFALVNAVDLGTNYLLHIRPLPTRTTVITWMILDELREKQ